MSRFDVTVTIDAPVQEVWDAFLDPSLVTRWMEGLQSVENLSGEHGEVGSRWRMIFLEHGKEVVLDETVTVVRPPEEFAFLVEHDAMSSESTVRFEADGAGTRLVSHTEAAGRGLLGRAMLGLMSGHMKKRQRADLERFKALVEERRARGASG